MANHVWVETRTPMAHVKTRSETMKTQARMTMGHVVGARFFDENVPIITINRGEVVPSFGSCPGGSDKSVRADVAPALRSAPADAEPRFGPCQWREKGREKGEVPLASRACRSWPGWSRHNGRRCNYGRGFPLCTRIKRG